MENSQHFITLAEIFQDGMVLQRGKAIKLWGTSQKAQRITVLLDKTVVLEAHIPEGSFAVSLPPQEAAENRTLCIQNADGETVSVANVDIGEVWIAGGQSNMEFQLQCDRNGDALIASADDVHLRYYEVGKYAFEGEREENLKDGRRWNHWRRFIPSECTHFSAVGTYFARYLRQELGVPVGIIGCCWGGTSATAWMDEALIRKDEQLKIYTDTYDKAVEKLNPEKYIQSDYKYRSFMGAEKNVVGSEATMKKEVTAPLKFPMRQIAKLMQNLLKPGPHSENRPGGLYQTMLSKITGYSTKGVLFYQGESDEHHASLYAHLFTQMIACWRNDWQEQLPFVFVQLPPGANGWAPTARISPSCVPSSNMLRIMRTMFTWPQSWTQAVSMISIPRTKSLWENGLLCLLWTRSMRKSRRMPRRPAFLRFNGRAPLSPCPSVMRRTDLRPRAALTASSP